MQSIISHRRAEGACLSYGLPASEHPGSSGTTLGSFWDVGFGGVIWGHLSQPTAHNAGQRSRQIAERLDLGRHERSDSGRSGACFGATNVGGPAKTAASTAAQARGPSETEGARHGPEHYEGSGHGVEPGGIEGEILKCAGCRRRNFGSKSEILKREGFREGG